MIQKKRKKEKKTESSIFTWKYSKYFVHKFSQFESFIRCVSRTLPCCWCCRLTTDWNKRLFSVAVVLWCISFLALDIHRWRCHRQFVVFIHTRRACARARCTERSFGVLHCRTVSWRTICDDIHLYRHDVAYSRTNPSLSTVNCIFFLSSLDFSPSVLRVPSRVCVCVCEKQWHYCCWILIRRRNFIQFRGARVHTQKAFPLIELQTKKKKNVVAVPERTHSQVPMLRTFVRILQLSSFAQNYFRVITFHEMTNNDRRKKRTKIARYLF